MIKFVRLDPLQYNMEKAVWDNLPPVVLNTANITHVRNIDVNKPEFEKICEGIIVVHATINKNQKEFKIRCDLITMLAILNDA